VAFFRGASLRPVPPGKSKHKEVRYLDIREDDEIDEAQLAAWVKQRANCLANECEGGVPPTFGNALALRLEAVPAMPFKEMGMRPIGWSIWRARPAIFVDERQNAIQIVDLP